MIRDAMGRDISADLDRYITGNYGEDQFRNEPRIGGIIEDETGWWQITAVEEEGVFLLGRDGTERWVSFENLGPVSYPEEP